MVSESQYRDYLQVRNLQFHPYQWEGLQWCCEQENDYIKGCDSDSVDNGCDDVDREGLRVKVQNKYKGGIVADEMGLGKTLLMIALISFHLRLRTLIVVPPILINQWKNQLFFLTGHQPLVYHGAQKKKITLEQLQQAPIVLVSYYAIALPIPDSSASESDVSLSLSLSLSLLHKVSWNRVIYDECHHLRNSNTALFFGAFHMKAKIKWFLSGTPLQNRIKDLTNLLSLLGYQEKLKEEGLKEILKKKMIKRTKQSVGLQMPELVEEHIVIPWVEEHNDTKVSQDIHSSISFSGVPVCRQTEFGLFLSQKKVIVAMLRAKQMCVYPRLIYDYMERRYQDEGYRQYPGNQKMGFMIEKIAERKGNGNGKLVFCQFLGEIDYLKERLGNMGIVVGVIDGRKKDKIDDVYEVLLLQIQSCCEGLNLQENYSEIYFSSSHWNPCVEEQAVGRCYRLGQKKPVYVFRYRMARLPKELDAKEAPLTLENYIDQVQDKKKALVEEFVATI